MSLWLEKERCCNRAHEHARVEGRPRQELKDKVKQRFDESPGAWVKRLQKIYTEMDEYNSMLEHEGEDCWGDESMDEEEERKEQEQENIGTSLKARKMRSEAPNMSRTMKNSLWLENLVKVV